MAHKCRSLRAVVLCGIGIIFETSLAAPTTAFPFNSQVPTVARVGQTYSFQFSSSTFAPDAANFTYSLSDQPAWLSLDSATRTMSGAPSQADVGASSFTLTAADSNGAAHMPCTLVVSTDPAPQIKGDISRQLAATANLSSSQPPVVTVLPTIPFHFKFEQDSFIDIVQRKLYYYATLTDHTPLPAWLLFDSESLTFSGVAPQLSAFPQSWDIELIASDVQGFSGAAASFTIAIGIQQLIFVPQARETNITAGTELNFTGLEDTLFMNGDAVSPSLLKSAQASGPSWVHFDPKTLAMSGTPPVGVSDQNVTVIVNDKFGNQAAAIVNLLAGNMSLFTGSVGTLTAQSGQNFDYHFPDALFAQQDVTLMLTLPESARWLQFDASSREMKGQVPTETSASTVQATLTASSSSVSDTQVFNIDIEPYTAKPSASGGSISPTSPTPTTEPTSLELDNKIWKPLTGGEIAAIVLATVITAALIAALLIFCWRQRRYEGYAEAASPANRTISRPILPPDPDSIRVTREVQTDVEKTAGSGVQGRQMREKESAPQIALDLPSNSNSRPSKWSKRFSRISQVSSIGNGEDAIRRDSNIPEIGRESVMLRTPHDSFSVTAEMARSSRHLSDLSPSKRALRRIREKRQSRQSVGLGIDTGGSGVLPLHSSRGAGSHNRATSSFGLSTTQDRSSITSLSTRGTSLLSTRQSDFPRPPTQSTMGGSKSIPTLSLTEAEKRKSIRLVERSDSMDDHRSMHEKRQSFIRKRASTTLASPLFAHGSRASSHMRGDEEEISNASQSRMSKHCSQRGRSQLTTYSESSSLEPPAKDSRRFSSRVRSAFAPNFPRAVTRSSLGADAAGGVEFDDSDSDYETIASDNELDLVAQLALPRDQRDFVLPAETPTPPPAPPTSRQPSSGGRASRQFSSGTRTSLSYQGRPRQKWKERLREHSSSPLSTAVAVPVADRNSLSSSARASQARRSKLSEPLSLVSNDSLSRAKLERPRLIHTNSKRPVSVEKVQRLSSLKAETDDARPGSEAWEALELAGLMPPNSSRDGLEGTQRSNMSGPAFL